VSSIVWGCLVKTRWFHAVGRLAQRFSKFDVTQKTWWRFSRYRSRYDWDNTGDIVFLMVLKYEGLRDLGTMNMDVTRRTVEKMVYNMVHDLSMKNSINFNFWSMSTGVLFQLANFDRDTYPPMPETWKISQVSTGPRWLPNSARFGTKRPGRVMFGSRYLQGTTDSPKPAA